MEQQKTFSLNNLPGAKMVQAMPSSSLDFQAPPVKSAPMKTLTSLVGATKITDKSYDPTIGMETEALQKMRQYERLLLQSKNPQQDMVRIQYASLLADRSQYSPEYVLSNLERVQQEILGFGENTTVYEGFRYAIASIQRAEKDQRITDSFASRADIIINGTKDPQERDALLEDLRKEFIAEQDKLPEFKNADTWVPFKWFEGLWGTIPYMGRIALQSGIGAGLTGIGAGLLLATLSNPIALAAMPVVAVMAAFGGRAAGFAESKKMLSSQHLMSRLMWEGDEGERVDPALAYWSSQVSGALSAATEMFILAKVISWVKPMVAANVMESLVSASVWAVVKSGGLLYGKSVLSQVSEEALQKIVEDVSDNMVKWMDEQMGGREWDRLSFADIMKNAGSEFLQSVPTMMVMGLVPGTIGTAGSLINLQKTRTYNAGAHFNTDMGSAVHVSQVFNPVSEYDKAEMDKRIDQARSGRSKFEPVKVIETGQTPNGVPMYRVVEGQGVFQALSERGVEAVQVEVVSRDGYVAPMTEANFQRFSDIANDMAASVDARVQVDGSNAVIIVPTDADVASAAQKIQLSRDSTIGYQDNTAVPADSGRYGEVVELDVLGQAGKIEIMSEGTYAARSLSYGAKLEKAVQTLAEAVGELSSRARDNRVDAIRKDLRALYRDVRGMDAKSAVEAMQKRAERIKKHLEALTSKEKAFLGDSYQELLDALDTQVDPASVAEKLQDLSARAMPADADKAPYEMTKEEYEASQSSLSENDIILSAEQERARRDDARNKWEKTSEKPITEARHGHVERISKKAADLDTKTEGKTSTVVVESPADLPVEVRDKAIENGIKPQDVTAVYFNGSVYIVASNLTLEEMEGTWAHEWIAHRGLRILFGSDFDVAMERLYDTQGKKIIEAAIPEYARSLDKVSQAEEYLAYTAQEMQRGGTISPAQRTFFQKALDLIRQLLRKIGINARLSDTEIRRMLADANSALERNTITTGAGPMFQVTQLQEGSDALFQMSPRVDTPAFKTWFEDSKVVDGEGKPLVVYHGSPLKGITSFDNTQAERVNQGEPGLVYATDSLEEAETFSYEQLPGNSNLTYFPGARGEVYPLYMSLQKPLDFRTLTNADYANITDAIKKHAVLPAEDLVTLQEARARESHGQFMKFLAKDLVSRLSEYGYDGMIAEMSKGGPLEFAAVSSTQVKSVGNRGTWDATNTGILFQTIDATKREVRRENNELYDAILSPRKLDILFKLKDSNAVAIEAYLQQTYEADDVAAYFKQIEKYHNRQAAKHVKGDSPISSNQKTLMSIDITTDCPMRSMSSPCPYCYVYIPRTMEQLGYGMLQSPKKVHQLIDYGDQILQMPDAMVSFFNSIGGLRMFASGDYTDAQNPHITKILEHAAQKGLMIKAITKQKAFLVDFAGHPNLRINISTDFFPEHAMEIASGRDSKMSTDRSLLYETLEQGSRLIGHGFMLEEAIALKEQYPNVRIRYVAVNKRDAYRAIMNPNIDVVTQYHGNTNPDILVDVWATQNPELLRQLGLDGVRELASVFHAASPITFMEKTAQGELDQVFGNGVVDVKEFAENAKEKMCCATKICATCTVKCGFAKDILFRVSDKARAALDITSHMNQVKAAVERGLPVPDRVLNDYIDQEWADREMQRRALFREYSWILDKAKDFETAAELRKWAVEQMHEQDMPEDSRLDGGFLEFYEQAMLMASSQDSGAYVMTFMDMVNNDRQLRQVVARIAENRESFLGLGLPRLAWDLVRKQEAGQQLTDGDVDLLRSYIARNQKKMARIYYGGMDDRMAIAQFAAEQQVYGDDLNARAPASQRVKDATLVRDPVLKKALVDGSVTYAQIVAYEDLVMREMKDLEQTASDLQAQVDSLNDSLLHEKKLREARLERDAVRRERKHMADLAARMRRPVSPTTTHYMTGRRVSAIAEMVVPTRWYRMEDQLGGSRKRGEADKARASDLIDYLLEPDSLLDTFLDRLKEFQGLTLNDFSSTQIEMLYEITEEMRANGRREMEKLLNERRERRGAAIGGIIKEVLRGEPQKVFENIGSLESKKEQRSSPVYAAQAASLRPSRMIRLFAGGIEGVFYEHFVNRVNRATDSEIREYKRRLNAGTALMKELKISAKTLDKEIEYDGVTMVTDDVLHLWLAMMNERSERAVVYGNKIDRSTIHGLTAQLSPELKKWGMAILADFESNYSRLNEAFIEDRNMDMGKEQAYFPMIRQDLDQMPLGDEFASQLAVRNAWRKGYADKKFTMSRVDINEANQKPIQLGATRLWLQQIEKQEHYIASQSLVKDLQNIADNRMLKDALKQRYGRRANEWLLKYINAYAQPNMYKTFDATSRFMSVIRGNMAVAYLGFNLLTVFKQAPSLAFYLRNANPFDMLKSASEMILHPLETMAFVNRMDPQMDMRSYDRITEELKISDPSKVVMAMKKIGQIGMKPVGFMDKVITAIGWKAVYEHELSKGSSEAEAVRIAQQVTLETQSTGRAKDLAEIYRSNEVLNWFTMFSNQLNQMWNIYVYDIPNEIKQREWTKLAGILAGIAVSCATMALLGGWRLPDDSEDIPKELLEQLLKELLAVVPFFGNGLSSGYDRRFGAGIEAFPIAYSAGKLISDLNGDSDSIGKDLLAVIEDLGMLTGAPVTGVRRAINVGRYRNLNELLGYGFTQYTR